MSSPSEDFSPVQVTSILSTDTTALPPGLLLLVVIVAIVGMLFILLVLWYFISGRARQAAKMNYGEDVSWERSIEVLREDASVRFEQSSLCYQDRGLLVVPRLNPGCSPSIFSGGLTLDGGLGSGEIELVTATVHANSNNEGLESETFVLESVDLDSPPDMEAQVAELTADENGKGTKNLDYLLVKNSTVCTSSMSLNVFLDCQEETPKVASLQVSRGGNSPNVSFRSAINSIRPKNSHSLSTNSMMSTSQVSPVYKIQFAGQGTSSVLPQKKKDSLWTQEEHCKVTLNHSIERGTEF